MINKLITLCRLILPISLRDSTQFHQLTSLKYVFCPPTATGNHASWNKGDKGFVAMARNGDLSGTFYTGLPAGSYCNVIQV